MNDIYSKIVESFVCPSVCRYVRMCIGMHACVPAHITYQVRASRLRDNRSRFFRVNILVFWMASPRPGAAQAEAPGRFQIPPPV